MGLKQATAITAILVSPLAVADTKDWEGEAELGVLKTTGNTEETNVNGRLGLVHEVTTWRNIGNFRSVYTQADDETTAERYRAELETNYKFDEHQYWFLRGGYEDDRFSGYDFQSSTTTGYGHRIMRWGERSFLDLSAGVGYRYNRLEEPDEDGNQAEEEAIARLAGQFDFALSETSLFRQKLSTEVGLDENNFISESETSIQANVVGSLSLKVAYRVEHLSDPPAGSDDTDTETSLTLLYAF